MDPKPPKCLRIAVLNSSVPGTRSSCAQFVQLRKEEIMGVEMLQPESAAQAAAREGGTAQRDLTDGDSPFEPLPTRVIITHLSARGLRHTALTFPNQLNARDFTEVLSGMATPHPHQLLHYRRPRLIRALSLGTEATHAFVEAKGSALAQTLAVVAAVCPLNPLVLCCVVLCCAVLCCAVLSSLPQSTHFSPPHLNTTDCQVDIVITIVNAHVFLTRCTPPILPRFVQGKNAAKHQS